MATIGKQLLHDLNTSNNITLNDIILYLTSLKEKNGDDFQRVNKLTEITLLLNSYKNLNNTQQLSFVELYKLKTKIKTIIPVLLQEYKEVDVHDEKIVTSIINHYNTINLYVKGSFWNKLQASIIDAFN